MTECRLCEVSPTSDFGRFHISWLRNSFLNTLKCICTLLEDKNEPYTDSDITWLEVILGSGYKHDTSCGLHMILWGGERKEEESAGEAEEVDGDSQVIESHQSSHPKIFFLRHHHWDNDLVVYGKSYLTMVHWDSKRKWCKRLLGNQCSTILPRATGATVTAL